MEIYISIVLAIMIGLYFIHIVIKLKLENDELVSINEELIANLVQNDWTINVLREERDKNLKECNKQNKFIEKKFVNMRTNRDYYKRKAFREEAIILLNKICTETVNETHIKEINKYIFNLKQCQNTKK